MPRRKHFALPKEPGITKITKLSHEGRGIAQINERSIFISNALPEETVEFVYTQLNKRYAAGKAINILQALPARITPPCEYFGTCGGCSLQHMSESLQLKFKQNTLLENLQHFAQTQPDTLLPPLTGPQYGYRHKARLGVRYVTKKQTVLVGFREAYSNYLTQMEHCAILAIPVNHLIVPLRDLINQLDAREAIAQIEIAKGDEQLALVFRNLQTLTAADREQLINFAQQQQLWLFLQPNKPEPLEKLWPTDTEDLLSYRHPQFNLTLWFHPLDFTQINPAINRDMVARAIQLLDLQREDTVLDLFCGLGNFTLPISQFAQQVTGVEVSTSMIERAQMNAQRNNISNITFHAADLSQPLNAAWSKQAYRKLMLDPPRSGALEIIPYVATWQPERIVYIACNPATLARDVGEFKKLGYRLAQAGIIDMFPQTSHVESIALLIRE